MVVATDVLKVRITRVETIPLHIPLKTPVKIASGGARQVVETLLVRLHSDAGVVGIGETQAWRRQGSSETLSSLTRVIADHFAPRVVGRSPFSIAAIMHGLDEAVYHSLYAQAPISDALYDLQGKLLGIPVHALLGGKCRERVSAAAVLFMKPTLEETVADALAFQTRGFNSFTIKVGTDHHDDVRNVSTLRERLGEAAILRVDANAGMSFDAALRLLKRIEPYDIDAAEQPLALWDLEGMAELARRIDIPLMSDECVSTRQDLLEVIKRRAANAVQSKVAKNGGIWHGRALWTIAATAGLRIYPGNHPSTSIATMSVAQQAAAWPGPLLDGAFAVGLENLAEDVVTEPVLMEGNAIRVNDAPGLGVTLDEDRVKHLRVDLQ